MKSENLTLVRFGTSSIQGHINECVQDLEYLCHMVMIDWELRKNKRIKKQIKQSCKTLKRVAETLGVTWKELMGLPMYGKEKTNEGRNHGGAGVVLMVRQ